MAVNDVKAGAPKIAGAQPAQVENRAQAKVEKNRGAVQPELRKITKADIAKLGGEQVADRPVRVRFAPSPTGHLHIGGARTALMNFLFAQKMGGEFVLRIEDTDQMRSRPEYTEAILDGLKWLGMNWDGEPIFQSRRTELYKEKVADLVKRGLAYADPQGSGAIFFKMPEEGMLTVNDRIKGTVNINVANADGNADYVIQRSDGSPTFLFANVLDDGEQGITHILRGDDHLSNAARQIPLFRAMGYEVPEFYHMPLIHGDPTVDPESGEVKPGGKLSKRHGATSVIDYQQLGYDAEVLMNHLARMGMRYETDGTVAISDLAKQFDPLNMSKSPSTLGMESLDARMMLKIKKTPTKELVTELKARIGDEQALKAHVEDVGTDKRDGFYLRTGVSAAEAREVVKGANDTVLTALAEGSKSRAKTYGDMMDILIFFRAQPVLLDEEKGVYANAPLKKLLGKLATELAKLPAADWNAKKLDDALAAFNGPAKTTYAEYGESLRWALTGVTDGLPLHNTLGIIGRDEALKRIASVVEG